MLAAPGRQADSHVTVLHLLCNREFSHVLCLVQPSRPFSMLDPSPAWLDVSLLQHTFIQMNGFYQASVELDNNMFESSVLEQGNI